MKDCTVFLSELHRLRLQVLDSVKSSSEEKPCWVKRFHTTISSQIFCPQLSRLCYG
jgi:hypothetical protein